MNADASPGAASLSELLDIEFGDVGPELAVATMPVAPKVLQPFGIVHGGAMAALAETVTSYATYIAVADDGMVAMGQSNSASFLRPITKGTITATARSRHRGRTTWIWDVELTDDEQRLCALVRMTVAVRPAP